MFKLSLFFLLPFHGLTDMLFIETNGIHTIPARPEMVSPILFAKSIIALEEAKRQFAFQIPHGGGRACRWHDLCVLRGLLRFRKARHHCFYMLHGPVALVCHQKCCANTQCPGHNMLITPREEWLLTMPWWCMGWDLFLCLGFRRYSGRIFIPDNALFKWHQKNFFLYVYSLSFTESNN